MTRAALLLVLLISGCATMVPDPAECIVRWVGPDGRTCFLTRGQTDRTRLPSVSPSEPRPAVLDDARAPGYDLPTVEGTAD